MGQPFSLDGRTALVVGGSRGIGAAMAEALARAGARVVIGGRSVAHLEAAGAQLRMDGLHVDLTPIDVTDGASIDAAVADAASKLGWLDILINAAGVSPIYKRAEQTAPSEWDEIIATNLTGIFRTCIAVGTLMLARRSGSIVNVLSVGAAVGLPRLAAYSASKAGALGFTRTLALEWADRNVRVNAIGPSFVRTDMTESLLRHERYSADIIASTPLGRFGEPEDVAGAALYLASDASRFVTGTTLFVDGGWLAR